MKKKGVVLLIILLFVISGCKSQVFNQNQNTDTQSTDMDNLDKLPSSRKLGEFQETACESADKYETCHKLEELGLVTKEKCCERINKCCD